MTQHISVYSQYRSVYSVHLSILSTFLVYSQYISVYSQHISVYSQYIFSISSVDCLWTEHDECCLFFQFTWKVFLIFKNENLMSFSLSAWAISSSTSNHYKEHSRGWEGDRQTDRQTWVSWLTDENTRDFAPGSCCCIWSNTCVMPMIFVEWLP